MKQTQIKNAQVIQEADAAQKLRMQKEQEMKREVSIFYVLCILICLATIYFVLVFVYVPVYSILRL